jgi:hypothetical protein
MKAPTEPDPKKKSSRRTNTLFSVASVPKPEEMAAEKVHLQPRGAVVDAVDDGREGAPGNAPEKGAPLLVPMADEVVSAVQVSVVLRLEEVRHQSSLLVGA